MRFGVGVFALLLAASAGPTAAATSVLLADGRTLNGVAVKPGPTAEQVVLEGAEGGPLTVGKDEILVVDFGKTPGKPAVPAVRLLNGDQLIGKVSFPGGRKVQLGTSWGVATLPFSWCGAVRLVEKMDLPAPGPRDAIFMTNGDRVEGEIHEIKEGKLTFKMDNVPAVPIELARIKAFTFAKAEPPAESTGGLQVALELGATERITARWAGIEKGNLKLQPAWGGTVELPLASLSRLEVKNGKLVYISDLKPADALHVPYLDGSHPHQANRSVGGRPLRLGGKLFARGLGVHSRSSLTYRLDGKFKTFAATLGIDSEVGYHGSVVFRVFGDGNMLFESPVLQGGDEAVELSVEVGRIQELRLEVDYGGDDDSADHADWADARLLRP